MRPKAGLAGNHQRCWIWGRHSVLESLRAGRWTPLIVLASRELPPEIQAEVAQRAVATGARLQVEPAAELTRRCRSNEHQGLAAQMPEFPYAALSDCLPSSGGPPFLLVLDGLQDPHNFGAVIRSAEVFGAQGVLVGTKNQCEVTPHVARASAGAINHVPLARIADWPAAIANLRRQGLKLIGASGDAPLELAQARLDGPLAIVIGNEGTGLTPDMRAACDFLVRIPQQGRTESLNAAVAAGIVCYEVRRQRRNLPTRDAP